MSIILLEWAVPLSRRLTLHGEHAVRASASCGEPVQAYGADSLGVDKDSVVGAGVRPEDVLMTHSQFVAKLADKVGISKAQAGTFLNEMVEMITSAVKKGEPVKIPDLGGWKKRKSAARTGRNPQTGEAIQIPARVKVRFTVAKGFKEAVLAKK
jgi:DNA-binding protein HU-beta